VSVAVLSREGAASARTAAPATTLRTVDPDSRRHGRAACTRPHRL